VGSVAVDLKKMTELMKKGWSWEGSGSADLIDAVAKLSEEMSVLEQNKLSIQLTDGIPNYGTAGQFAVSDGKGGIVWKTLVEAEEVSY
jgi:hypothetical protein